MICSGYLADLWKIYIMFYCKYIHIHNIKIPIYLCKKLEEFKGISTKTDFKKRRYHKKYFFYNYTHFLRDKKMNTLCFLCLFSFNLEKMYDHLNADNVEYIKPFFKQQDPKEFLYTPK